MIEKPLWKPSGDRIGKSNALRFINHLINNQIISNQPEGSEENLWHELYQISIRDPKTFWCELLNFLPLRFSGTLEPYIDDVSVKDGIWFPNLRLNFAYNLLFPKALQGNYDKEAVVFRCEDGNRRSLTYYDLQLQTACLIKFFKQQNIRCNDRVVALMPNTMETVITMLASSYLGAIFSSCAPAFGAPQVIDRFKQLDPKVLIISDGYEYGQKIYRIADQVDTIIKALPTLEMVILVSHLTNADKQESSTSVAQGELPFYNWNNIQQCNQIDDVNSVYSNDSYNEYPFNHPLYILFSSGTTGKPKCIVHGAGGTLLEHLKELSIHTDVKEDDVIFYQTNCSWMMWNWLISALGTGAKVILYDGSPLIDDYKVLFKLAEEEKVSVFGTNPKFLSLVEKSGLIPAQCFDLSSLRTILSTGSPLLPTGFKFVYDAIKSDCHLASISGGTDIIGCFALGSPLLPVYCGELQSRSLGYRVEVYDDLGNALINQSGELVCTLPFPSKPVCFWNDPEGDLFKRTYFSLYPNVWHHGDLVTLNHRGGMIFSGRSDAVLNPGGVRIGTAEIYRHVEAIPEISDCLAVSQNWKGDTRIILFIKLHTGKTLTLSLIDQIKKSLRKNASPFHVPAKILQVRDIPRTHSGKITEITVTRIINGHEPKNIDSLANPTCLTEYRNRHELLED